MKSRYDILKNHFDGIATGQKFPINPGLEHIRDTYENAFDQRISLYDIYQTSLEIPTNRVSKIMTLTNGTRDNKDTVTGIMWEDDLLVSTNKLTNPTYAVNAKNIDVYIKDVYTSISDIIKCDDIYSFDRDFRKRNHYARLLRILPMYLTYFHIKTCFYEDSLDDIKAMHNWSVLKSDIKCTDKTLNDVLCVLARISYSRDIDKIYNDLFIDGKIKIV